MDIDWFTFGAQIVNFLVLVALLRWLLYGRIVRAMQEREQRIADRMQEADRRREEAEEKVEQYEEKTRELNRQREELLRQAHHDARDEHERLTKDAKSEVDRKREDWHAAFRRERNDLLSDVARQAARMGVEAARKTLAQLADADLEQRMCDTFLARLRELDAEQRKEIALHLGDGEADVFVRSTFNVPDERRARLRETIRESFDHDGEISFQTSDDLICGLELNVGGYSFGWNVKEWLHGLALELDERLESLHK